MEDLPGFGMWKDRDDTDFEEGYWVEGHTGFFIYCADATYIEVIG